MLLVARSGISRMLMVVALVVVVVGAGGVILLSGGGSAGSGPLLFQIIETDPVNQVDSLSPINATVAHGSITIAVQNHDDAPRNFEITSLNINQTVGSGSTERISVTVAPGTYQIYIPPRPPYNGFKASPSMTGYLIVT